MLEEAVVGIAQWLPRPGKPEKNLEAAKRFIAELGLASCDLVVLPELWLCGYDPESLPRDAEAAAETLGGPLTRSLASAARDSGVWLAAGSVPERCGANIYNTALLFRRDGTLHAVHRKAHLFPGEEAVFSPGNSLTICDTDDFGKVGIAICFDGDFPEVARAFADRGVRFVIQMSAYSIRAAFWWDRLYPAHALANGQWWVMANQCGTDSAWTLYGGSQVISPSGETVARGCTATCGDMPPPDVVVASIRLQDDLHRADRMAAILRESRRPELYADTRTASAPKTR